MDWVIPKLNNNTISFAASKTLGTQIEFGWLELNKIQTFQPIILFVEDVHQFIVLSITIP